MIRSLHFDMACLFQNASSCFIARLAGIKIRVGYNTDGKGFPVPLRCERAEVLKQHQVEYYLTFLRALGWDARPGTRC